MRIEHTQEGAPAFTLYASPYRGRNKVAEYPNQIIIDCLQALENACNYDHIASECVNNHRAEKDYLQCNVMHMDLDNSHSEDPESWKTLDDIAEALPDVMFYYIKSRHYMKPKTDSTGEILEPREKYHLYFPQKNTIGSYEAESRLRSFACCMFPYFDQKCIDPVHFFYGVENAEGGFYDGSKCIDEYLQELGSNVLAEAHRCVKEYNAQGFRGVDALNKFLGIATAEPKPRTGATSSGIDASKVQNGERYFENLAKLNNVTYTKAKNESSYEVECPWSNEHSDNETTATVYIEPYGQYAGRLCFHCFHDHCAGRSWKEYKEKVFKNMPDLTEEEEKRIEQGFQTLKASKEQEEQKPTKVKKLSTISARALQQKNLPPIRYIVKDLIPQGETVIAAPPKSGKSWLMLQLCLSVARGEPFLGLETEQCTTLYLALEDGDNFEQKRLIKQCPDEAPENFHYAFSDVERMESGLLEQLADFVEEQPETGLIVIDTLAYVKSSQKRQETAYECDYRTGKELKAFADAHNLAIVVITHTTKITHPEDPFSNITGTMGVSGAADGLAVLVREKRFDKECTLAVTGRRIPMNEYKIAWNKEACIWEMIGLIDSGENTDERREYHEYMSSDIRKAVLKIAQNNGKWQGSAYKIKEVAAELDIFISEPNKEIGGFMCRHIGNFGKYDGIKVKTISNGHASKLYSIDYIATGNQTEL